jgi:hypothetical protein
MAPQSFVAPWPIFQFLNLKHSLKDSLDGGTARCMAYTYTQNNINKINGQTSMFRVGFELTISVLEKANRVHALNRTATAIGLTQHGVYKTTTANEK